MTIDIAFSLNQGVMVGMLAALNSVVCNTRTAEALRFNIAVPPDEAADFEAALNHYFPQSPFQWRLATFTPPQYLADYLNHKFQPQTASRQKSRYMQYARLFLGSLFPDLTKVIYLDSDVIVLEDMARLFKGTQLTPATYFAAVPHFFPAIFYFGKPLQAIQEARQFEQAFNSGLIVTDVSHWTTTTYDRMRHYMDWDISYDYKMLNLGDETLLNLMFKQYQPLDARWNRCGYGNIRPLAWLLKKPLKDIAVIHWSGGHHKPWRTANIVYGDIWRRYDLMGTPALSN